jgi:hypothetical protein
MGILVFLCSRRTSPCQHSSAINAAREETDDEVEVPVCWNCGGTPCDWERFSDEVLEEIDAKFPVGENGE